MPGFMRAAITCIVCVCFYYNTSASAEQNNITLSLDQAVEQALLNNPDLSALKERTLALADIPEQQGALPDPQLTFRASNLPVDTFAIDQEPMTQMQIALSQALPFPGKLSLRQQVADLESRAANFGFEEKRLLLVQDVKTVWWNIYYLDRALETVERNQELFRQLNTITQTKYKVGKGLQQEVLMAQLELTKLLDNKISLTNMRRNEAIRLNTLIAQPAETVLLLPQLKEEEFPEVPDLSQLLDQAQSSSPMIQDLSNKAEAAKTKVELAEKKYYPDFMAGATYGYRAGENPDGSERADFATFSVTLNLPFFNQTEKKRAISQSKHEALQQSETLISAENIVQGRVTTAYSDYKKSQEEMELLGSGIIPLAKQTLESMMAGYQVNKVDFLNLVGAQTSLYNYETRYWKSYSSANQALARLAAAIGREAISE